METITKTRRWLSSPHMGEMEQGFVKEAFDANFTYDTWEDLFNRKLCLPNDSNLKGEDLQEMLTISLK